MSVVIVGGNDRMTRQYKNICEAYRCRAKVFTQMQGLKEKIGSPDLLVLFTGTVSQQFGIGVAEDIGSSCGGAGSMKNGSFWNFAPPPTPSPKGEGAMLQGASPPALPYY